MVTPPIPLDELLVADLGENGGSVGFRSVDELRDWAQKQQKDWARVVGTNRDNSGLHNGAREAQNRGITDLGSVLIKGFP